VVAAVAEQASADQTPVACATAVEQVEVLVTANK
jgi:hypothetical protein